MGCGGGADQGPLLNQQNAQKNALNAATGRIQDAFSGFTPNFYQGVAQAYQNQALPQLQQQYRNNSTQFGFKMADQGLGKSSQATQGYNSLADANNQAKTQIAQQGQQQAQNLQQQVSGQESNLMGMAQSASNPGQMATQAQATAAGITAPSTFAPIGQLLSQWTSMYLGGQQQQLGNNMSNALSQMYLMNPYSSSGSYAGALPSN